jgi:hypothetical protein
MNKESMSRLSFSCIFLFFFPFSSFAQSANNEIANRISLISDANPIFSTSENNTVEWQCVAPSLVEKCMTYHNDQWFSFTPEFTGDFYFSIVDQQCRDLRGMQLHIIEGTACQPESYQVLDCISPLTQDDFYIVVSLEKGKEYLINVDGLLADVCKFGIMVTSTPPYFSWKVIPENWMLNHVIEDAEITLNWELPDSLMRETGGFEIHRFPPKGKKFEKIAKTPLNRNAFGLNDRAYSWSENLIEHGSYTYRVFWNNGQGERYLIAEKQLVFKKENRSPFIDIPLSHVKKETIEIFIFSPDGQVLIKKIRFEKMTPSPTYRHQMMLPLWKGYGYASVKVSYHSQKRTMNHLLKIEIE